MKSAQDGQADSFVKDADLLRAKIDFTTKKLDSVAANVDQNAAALETLNLRDKEQAETNSKVKQRIFDCEQSISRTDIRINEQLPLFLSKDDFDDERESLMMMIDKQGKESLAIRELVATNDNNI